MMSFVKRKSIAMFWLSRTNLKISLVSLIGLIIALSMTSAYLIYIDTSRADYYMGMFDVFPIEDRQLKFKMDIYPDYSDEYPVNGSYVRAAQDYLNGKIAEFNLTNILIQKYSRIRISDTYPVVFLNQTPCESLFGLDFDQSILSDCITGSTLPGAVNEVIVFSKRITTPFAIGDSFNLSYNQNLGRYCNTSLKISGIINPESLQIDSYVDDIVRYNNWDDTDYMLITNIDNYFNILQLLGDEVSFLSNITTHLFSSRVIFSYDINVNRNNVVKTVADSLIPFMEDADRNERRNFKLFVYPFFGSKSFKPLIKNFNTTLLYALLILSIPSFLLAYLLANFSLGLTNDSRMKLLGLLQMRGISSRFIFPVIIAEILIMTTLATLIGFIIGIPLSLLLYSTTGFLMFNSDVFEVSPVFTSSTLQTSLLIGFFFTFLSYSSSLWQLSRFSIVTDESETIRRRRRRFRIFKGNRDLYLLVLGTMGLLVFRILLEIITNSRDLSFDLLTLFSPMILYLVFFSILSLLIGFLLAFNRFIPVILHHTGKFFLKRNWWFLGTAARNLLVQVRTTVRLTLLISIAVSFLVILAILPISLEQYNVENAYYVHGSDIVITTYQLDTENIDDLTTQLQTISGLAVSQVSTTGAYQRIENNRAIWIELMGIEEKFPLVAHWREHYADESLEDLVSSLFSSRQEFPVLIDSKTTAREKLTIQSDYLVPMSITGGTITLNVTIEGIFDLIPGLNDGGGQENQFIVTKRSLLEKLTNQYEFSHGLRTHIWCKLTAGFDQEIVDQVREVTERYVIQEYEFQTVLEQLYPNTNVYMSNIQWITAYFGNILWIITNFAFITALIITMVIIVLFTVNRILNNENEIGLSRTLGLKRSQLFLLLITEPLILFLISSIPGATIGGALLIGIVMMIESSLILESGPPFALISDLNIILLIFGSILFVTLVSGLIISLIVTRVNVSRILMAKGT